MATQKERPVKCKLCEKKLVSKSALIDHIERVHAASIPKGWSPARYENYLRTGKTEGRCVECHNVTTWNEATGKYNRMCGSEACKKKARERASKNYIGLHGKPYSINNPEQQAKMVYGRKTAGTYVFEDERTGKKYEAKYDSSYGKDFLEMLDTFLNWDGQDVTAPSPHVYWYTYEGEKHFYMPDVYLHTLNLEVELKDGGDNPNMHPKIQAVDKVKEVAKDKVMESLKGQVNYIKICNKDYKEFFALLSRLKAQDECPLPKWESRLETAMESSSHTGDDNKVSEQFTAYHLEEKKVSGSPWDEELYSKTLDQEIRNVLSSVSRDVQKGKTTRFVYTLGKDYKAVLLGAITIFWYDYWDHADPQYDWEWDYQEEFDIDEVDEQYIVQEAADPFKPKINLLKRNKLLTDPMLNYDDLLLYYRNQLFHKRLNKQQWVMLYSELENVRDYLKSVINSNSENDIRMKYEAKKALAEVTGFLTYMDDENATNTAKEKSITEGTDIFTSGDFADYAQFADLDAARGDVEPALENILISKDNLEINMDKWAPGTPLWITGTSGDGKSTLSAKLAKEHNAIIIHTDLILIRVAKPREKFERWVARGTQNKSHPMNTNGMEFIQAHPEMPYDKGYGTEETHKYFLLFLQWIIEACKTNPKYNKKKVIVEGSDIGLLGADFLSQQPLIIIGCSRFKAGWQRVKREHASGVPYLEAIFKVIQRYDSIVRPLDENKEKLWADVTARMEGTSLMESDVSHIDKDYKGKERYELSKYRRVSIGRDALTKYKPEYPFLKHVREDDGGVIWLDGNKVVGVLGAAPHKETVDQKQIWIHSFEISKEYQNHGLSRQMLDYAIHNLGAQYLTVAKRNEVAIELYKKMGFVNYGENKTQWFMKLKNAPTPEFVPISESVMEGTIITKDDIRHNLDNWKPGVDTNILLVTGLSGSGKTTTGYEMAYDYKAEVFQLDWINNPQYMKDSPETPNYGLWQYVKKKCALDLNQDGWRNKKDGWQLWKQRVFHVFDTIREFAKTHPDRLFIVEGIQIPGVLHDYPGIEKFPIIIKGTSMMTSMFRRLKRDGLYDGLMKTGNSNILTYYLDTERRLNHFTNQITMENNISGNETFYNPSENDVMEIVSSMSPNEQNYVGCPNGAKFFWWNRVFYKEAIKVDGEPVSYILAYTTPTTKDTAHIVLGTKRGRGGQGYRHRGYSKELVKRFMNARKPGTIKYIEWGYDKGNSKSAQFAKDAGFHKFSKTEDGSTAKVPKQEFKKNAVAMECADERYRIVDMNDPAIQSAIMNDYSKLVRSIAETNGEVIRKSLIREENWYNTLESTYIEASKNDDRYFPVFVFLSYTGTNMAKLVKAFTHDPYAHSSLSLDTNLENMVSFNRDGMVIENIHQSVFKKNAANIRYSLYMYMATAAEYDAMKNFIDELLGRKSKLKYNILGLTNFIFGRGSTREDRYFCSEFIAATISAGNDKIFDRQPYMITPYYFAKNKNFIFIKTGLLKNYDQKVVDKLVAEKLEEGGFSDVVIK